jgi:hypothetical protein
VNGAKSGGLVRKTRRSDITVVQLHDATIIDLQLRANGRLIIRLDGVSVFRRVSAGLADVFIHKGRLEIDGLSSLSLKGRGWLVDDDDYILDDTITDELGRTLHWVDLDPNEVRRVELVIFSGSRIEISCSRAKLELARQAEFSRQWPDKSL